MSNLNHIHEDINNYELDTPRPTKQHKKELRSTIDFNSSIQFDGPRPLAKKKELHATSELHSNHEFNDPHPHPRHSTKHKELHAYSELHSNHEFNDPHHHPRHSTKHKELPSASETDEFSDTDKFNSSMSYSERGDITDFETDTDDTLSLHEEDLNNMRKTTTASTETKTTTTLSDDSDYGGEGWFEKLKRRGQLLTILNVLGFILGYGLGILLKYLYGECFWTPRKIMYIGFPGRIFFRILSCLKIPICVSSIIAAIGSMDLHTSGFIARKAVMYCLFTMLIGTALASVVVFRMGQHLTLTSKECPGDICIKPCAWWHRVETSIDDECVNSVDFYMDYFRTMLPSNMIELFINSEVTKLDLLRPTGTTKKQYKSCEEYVADTTPNRPDLNSFQIVHSSTDGTNMFGMYAITIFIGICVLLAGEAGKPFLNVFVSASEVFLVMASWALRLGPLGIISSMASQVISHNFLRDLSPALIRLLIISIILQLIQAFLILPLFYFVMTKKSPIKFYIRISAVIATAFGTCSSLVCLFGAWLLAFSAGTMPLTIKTLEDNARLDPRVVRFMIPILTILNASGTLVYISFNLAFLLLRHKGTIPILTQISSIFVTYLMSIAANTGLPVDGTLSIPNILTVFGQDSKVAFELLPVYWVMDPFATVGNVVGDCVCLAVINHKGKDKLRFLHEAEEKAIREMELNEANQQWSNMGMSQQRFTPPVINVMDITDV